VEIGEKMTDVRFRAARGELPGQLATPAEDAWRGIIAFFDTHLRAGVETR